MGVTRLFGQEACSASRPWRWTTWLRSKSALRCTPAWVARVSRHSASAWRTAVDAPPCRRASSPIDNCSSRRWRRWPSNCSTLIALSPSTSSSPWTDKPER